MSRVLRANEVPIGEVELSVPEKLLGMLPVITPIVLAVAIILARLQFGRNGFLNEGALTMLALVGYITAAVLLLTNLFVKDKLLNRLGLMTVAMAYCFNLSGWMMRWIEAGDAEGWKAGINGVWRYFPLDNLYALTLGFCCGAALTTLVIIRKPKYQFLGALSLPILAVVLTLGVFLGNEIRTLQPVLDSYWRPIHVSIATVAYGVCLVSFGLAFAYLLKDGVRSEAMAIAVALFGLLVYGMAGRYDPGVDSHSGVLPDFEYGPSVFFQKFALPARAALPGVGPLMGITAIVILASLALFVIYWLKNNEGARKWAWNLFRGALVLQAVVLAVLFYQIKNVNNLGPRIPPSQYAAFGGWLNEKTKGEMPADKHDQIASDWIQRNGPDFTVSVNSNPVELGAIIGLFVALLMVSLFAWKRSEVEKALPPLQSIDSLLYRTVGVAFPLLSMLLITGAVWANESWGRYWGWDSKETGALVAWMAYAGFLHTRIAHGWRGRRSAYFAMLGFSLVVFTWLGVSFLLKGLHSYAE
jgi:ABC-type transport system involved in cytochrome c biogenesis permease subunit